MERNDLVPPPADSLRWQTLLIRMAIVVGVIGVLLLIAIPNFQEAQIRSKIGHPKSGMRSLGTALESYYEENKAYPPCARGDVGENYWLPANNPARNLHTFQRMSEGMNTLTTPVAHISSYPRCWGPDAPIFLYYNANNQGWLVYGAVVSGKYIINPEEDYIPGKPATEQLRLTAKTYDTTNGTYSEGNIWRIKEQ
jgi:Tfp pilus assembly protein PilE